MNRPGTVLLALASCGCAPAQPGAVSLAPPQVVPTLAAADAQTYQQMAIAAAMEVESVANGRTIGIYRSEHEAPAMLAVVDAVIKARDFRAVQLNEGKVACAPTKPRSPGVMPTLPDCHIDVADIVLQLNWVQIVGDTGYVGGFRTEVPRNSDKPRTIAFCLLAVGQRTVWDGVRYIEVEKPRDCAAGGKH